MLKTAIIACAICASVGGTVIWQKVAAPTQDRPLAATSPGASPALASTNRIVPMDPTGHDLGWGPVRTTDW
jgi:hypothetical protein